MKLTAVVEGRDAFLVDNEIKGLNRKMIASTLIRLGRLFGQLAAVRGVSSAAIVDFSLHVAEAYCRIWAEPSSRSDLACNGRVVVQCDSALPSATLLDGNDLAWDDLQSAFILLIRLFASSPNFIRSTYSRFAITVGDSIVEGYRECMPYDDSQSIRNRLCLLVDGLLGAKTPESDGIE